MLSSSLLLLSLRVWRYLLRSSSRECYRWIRLEETIPTTPRSWRTDHFLYLYRIYIIFVYFTVEIGCGMGECHTCEHPHKDNTVRIGSTRRFQRYQALPKRMSAWISIQYMLFSNIYQPKSAVVWVGAIHAR